MMSVSHNCHGCAAVRAATYSKTYTSKEVSLPRLLELLMAVLDHAFTPAEDQWTP